MTAPTPAPATGVLSSGALRCTTLPGGLRVVTEHLPGAAETAVGITSRVGVRDEPARHAGITAALADRLHRRTRTLTAPHLSGSAPADPGTERCPGPVVGREHLHLGLTLTPHISPEALLEAWAPVFTRQDTGLFAVAPLHRRPSPAERLTGLFDEALFGPGHPLGRALIGTATTRARTRTPALVGWHRTLFTGPNTILAAAGPVDHQAWVEAARTHLMLPPGPTLRRIPVLGHGRIRPARRTTPFPASAYRVMVGVQGLGVDDARSHTLAVVAHLAQARTAHLEGRGRVERYSDTGSVALHATDVGPAEQTLADLHRVWDDLAAGRFTDTDLHTARRRARTHLEALTRTPYGRMRRLSALALYTRPRPAGQDLDAVLNVQQPDVAQTAALLLSRPRVQVVLGPDTDPGQAS